MGLIGLIVASYGGLEVILSGLTKSTDPPSRLHVGVVGDTRWTYAAKHLSTDQTTIPEA